MGHTLDLAVRPNKVRNVCGVGIGARQGGYSNHAVYKAEELSMRKLKLVGTYSVRPARGGGCYSRLQMPGIL